MNKRVLVVIIVLAVVIGGAVGGLALDRALDPPLPTPVANDTSEDPAEGSASAGVPGTYIDWTESAIAEAPGKVVLFFHAPWCGQCRELEQGILADGVPEGVTVIKVDWDSRQDLELKYDVPMRTTFVELDDDGAVVQRLTAYDDPRWAAVIDTMNL